MEFLKLHIKKANYFLLFLLFLYVLDQIWTLVEFSIRYMAQWGEIHYPTTIMHALYILLLVTIGVFIYRQKRIGYWGLVCVIALSLVFILWMFSVSSNTNSEFAVVLKFAAIFLIKVFLIILSLIMLRLKKEINASIKSGAEALVSRKKLSFYIKIAAIITTFLVISVQLGALFDGVGGLVEGDSSMIYLLVFLYIWLFSLLYVTIIVVVAYKIFYSKFSLFLLFLVALCLYPAMLLLFNLIHGFESGLGLIILLLYGEPIVFILSLILSLILYIKREKYIQKQ